MKYIVPIAVLAIIVLHWADAFPKGSVGGSMMIALVFLAAALAVAIYDAWSNRRGVLGWIVNLVTAFVATFISAEVVNLLIEPILMNLSLEGSLAGTRHPMLYISSAAMMLIILFGTWLALQAINRFR